jgi:hypothetical protein
MARWRTVRVFISSTFRNMHAEWDRLVKVVFPALRERLEPHRVHLIDIDLRWGVTREQAENDRVLDLCLQQIDECRPFFIGILGQRHGWVPTRLPADASNGPRSRTPPADSDRAPPPAARTQRPPRTAARPRAHGPSHTAPRPRRARTGQPAGGRPGLPRAAPRHRAFPKSKT